MSSTHEDARLQARPHRIAVAVEVASDDRARIAHAIPPSMVDLGRHGLTTCGFPVDHLRIVPDLDWTDIDLVERCEHCSDPTP
jgi:hypothetical protein